jgi:hypothetical protein
MIKVDNVMSIFEMIDMETFGERLYPTLESKAAYIFYSFIGIEGRKYRKRRKNRSQRSVELPRKRI